MKCFLDAKNESGQPATLEKSYSPVSLPTVSGFFDLLVKKYPPRDGGGMGAHLCDLEVDDPHNDIAAFKIKKVLFFSRMKFIMVRFLFSR